MSLVYVLLGPPGCGKGTQAAMLKTKLSSVASISTGDMLRASISKGDNLGLKIKSVVESGHLVSDDLMLNVVRQSIEEAVNNQLSVILLDGYPRTLVQGQQMDSILSDMKDKASFAGAINFGINHEILIKRLSGRWICKNCGAIFNEYYKAPIKEGVCDICSSPLFKRKDDNADVVESRLKVYEENTFPLIKFYQDKNCLYSVDAEKSEEDLAQDIINILKKR